LPAHAHPSQLIIVVGIVDGKNQRAVDQRTSTPQAFVALAVTERQQVGYEAGYGLALAAHAALQMA